MQCITYRIDFSIWPGALTFKGSPGKKIKRFRRLRYRITVNLKVNCLFLSSGRCLNDLVFKRH